jgi:hypothetical protein
VKSAAPQSRSRSPATRLFLIASLLTLMLSMKSASGDAESGAYCRREGMTWTLGTSRVERRIAFERGQLRLTSLHNKVNNREYRDSGAAPSEIRFTVDGEDVDSPSWNWRFVRDQTHRLKNGELQLDIELNTDSVGVTKHWVAYPDTGVIREWISVQNRSRKRIGLQNVFFLNTRVLGVAANRLEVNYITGGGNFNGSQLLKTKRLDRTSPLIFDSNVGVQKGNYSAYLPLLLLRDPQRDSTLAAGWDYMGHWQLNVGASANDPVNVALEIAGYDEKLSPGAQINTPKSFIGVLSGDLDDIGNQVLDWQYRYFWDLTNPDYFGKTRWAVDWPPPWVGPGGTPSADNWGRRLALDMRYVDLLREAGGDILWDDAGWYDQWGSWNGPDWSLATAYARKHDMRWVLWYPTFLATSESRVGQEHPEWLISREMEFEQSIPATGAWQKSLLDRGVAAWGDFQWRYDIAPAASATDTKLLAADQNFRELVEQFKTSHPNSGVDACDGGGRWISYDLSRLAESGEYTDGGVGPYSGYYTSLLVSPDKLHNVSDFDHTYYVAASDHIHLALDPTWYRDPGDGPDVEAIRKDWEIYHYLIAQGVAGRWSHVFRPSVKNDDPVWYFQRMDARGSKGIIIAKHAKVGAEYFLVSKPITNTEDDHYEGGPWQMPSVLTDEAVRFDTGIYSDPTDGGYGYYGVPGEEYGPLNFRYDVQGRARSFVTQLVRHGVSNLATSKFFGLAFQTGAEPVTISELGQYDPGKNLGTYSLSMVRASDKAVLGVATLDMKHAQADALGFKYAKLPKAITLAADQDYSVTIFPRGLQPNTTYDVRTYKAHIHAQRLGSDLMKNGIALSQIAPGELIFLNLPGYPGSGTDMVAPEPPSNVTKRHGMNLGIQGVEISWSPGRDDTWLSYYEILRDGQPIAKAAKGTFYFDHSPEARNSLGSRYEVRTVDGDGNRSSSVAARETPGGEREPQTFEALGDFSPTQGGSGWRYEQSADGQTYTNLAWTNGGYEGFWAGSGLGRIGTIWMQPSAAMELSRTFLSPEDGPVDLRGEVEKDPSADPTAPVFVKIYRQNEQIWPAAKWAPVPPFGVPLTYQLKDVSIRKGEVIRFFIKRNGENRAEPIIWNPSIIFGKHS